MSACSPVEERPACPESVCLGHWLLAAAKSVGATARGRGVAAPQRLLAFYFAISPLLIGMGFLGGARQAIPEVAVKRIADLPGDLHIGLVTAILVVVAWAAAALGLGGWRTSTPEIY
jgi:hypothetical protein